MAGTEDPQQAASAGTEAALHAEIARLRAEAEDLRRSLAHDLRARLRHILSYAQLVQEEAAPLLSTQVQGFLATIHTSAQELAAMLDGLMELSRLSTVALQWQSVPTQPLVQRWIEQWQQTPQNAAAAALDSASARAAAAPALAGVVDKGVAAPEFQVDGDLPVVRADAALLQLAVAQILDNAVKFSAGATAARIHVRALERNAQGLVGLEIADNGAGCNAAQSDALFHPFARLHSARQFPGLGLGLARAQRIVQRLDGSLTLDSAVGAGCRVRVLLQAAD